MVIKLYKQISFKSSDNYTLIKRNHFYIVCGWIYIYLYMGVYKCWFHEASRNFNIWYIKIFFMKITSFLNYNLVTFFYTFTSSVKCWKKITLSISNNNKHSKVVLFFTYFYLFFPFLNNIQTKGGINYLVSLGRLTMGKVIFLFIYSWNWINQT